MPSRWQETQSRKAELKRLGLANGLNSDDFNNAFRFYELAEKRNEVLADRALDVMHHQKLKQMVLITGGFHTKGITAILKKRKISYFVIQPALDTLAEDPVYRNAVGGLWKTVFDQAQISNVLGATEHLRELEAMGSDPGRRIRVRLDTALGVLARRWTQRLKAWGLPF